MFSVQMVRWSNFALKPAKSNEMGQYGHKRNTAAFHNATVPLLHYENSVSKQRYEKPGMIPGQIVTYKFRCLCVYGLANKPPYYRGNSLSLPCLFTSYRHPRYFDRRARFAGCGFLLPVVRIPRPNFGCQFRVILAHIIVQVQFAVKACFQ